MTELLVFAVVGALVWFWVDSMGAREAATRVGRLACEREGVQFLDYTVAIARLRLGRDGRGHLMLRRTYRFEFSDTGDNRREGVVVMLGRRAESVEMEPHRFVEAP